MTILILETVDAYPRGKRRRFTAGETVAVAEVGEDLAALLVAKGHAEDSTAQARKAGEKKGK